MHLSTISYYIWHFCKNCLQYSIDVVIIFPKDVVLRWHIHIVRKFSLATLLVIKSVMSQTKTSLLVWPDLNPDLTLPGFVA